MRLKHLTIAALLASAVALPAAADTLRVGIAAEPYPPFFVLDASGQWTGWEIDVTKAICAKMAADCQIVPTAWDSLIPELTGGKIDMLVASMSITAERQKTIDFSIPYYSTPAVLVAAKDAPDGTEPAALAGKTIGVQQSTIHQSYAEHYFKDATVKVYQTQDEANQDLANGRLDYVQADILAMSDFVKTDAGKACCRIVGPVAADPAILGEGVGVGIRKGEAALKTRIDEAITAIKADGSYKSMVDKYFDVDISGDKG